MKNLYSIFFLLISINISGQTPLIKQWDYRYGGLNSEWLSLICPTIDGGYLLGGHSNSNNDGDKTDTCRGSFDFYIVKVYPSGIKEWDKSYGGTENDYMRWLQMTKDGGYVLGGYTYSGTSGEVTQPNWDSSNLSADFWLVKTDAAGNKLWDKRYGGDSYEEMNALQQTHDGGYILGGYSESGISGDKTDTIRGIMDYWVVKVDSLGIVQWDKTYGGTSMDYVISILETNSNGYLIGGISGSGINGDKTSPNKGSFDYWIIKTDSLGNKLWDKTYGGSSNDLLRSILYTTNGFFLGGESSSPISFDKTVANHDSGFSVFGIYDYWLIKCDLNGNIIWDKTYGGSAIEEFCLVTKTIDDNLLVSGTSYSPISGDKTENNMALEQTWVLKIDTNGNKIWDKTLQTNQTGDDESGYAIQNQEGCYLMANHTHSFIGGDKTQDLWGGNDYWIIKFCDGPPTSIPEYPFQNTEMIYPNPFSFQASIQLNSYYLQNATLIVDNCLGQTVAQINNLSGQTIVINRNNLPCGLYFFRLTEQNKIISVGKLVINDD